MDLEFTIEEQAFQAEVRDWLSDNLPDDVVRACEQRLERRHRDVGRAEEDDAEGSQGQACSAASCFLRFLT